MYGLDAGPGLNGLPDEEITVGSTRSEMELKESGHRGTLRVGCILLKLASQKPQAASRADSVGRAREDCKAEPRHNRLGITDAPGRVGDFRLLPKDTR
jgi:hypothetical protein